jgi:hypothetical protein
MADMIVGESQGDIQGRFSTITARERVAPAAL